jgi:tetratricopeptide (TPR) repeat protein
MPKAEVFISIGNGYEKLKRDVSAIEAYQKAIDADPNSALAYSYYIAHTLHHPLAIVSSVT